MHKQQTVLCINEKGNQNIPLLLGISQIPLRYLVRSWSATSF